MISIFRKIRQAMVKEKKVRNYALYALGEILLVMIGILLALQVNNWNEKRKSKNQFTSILKTIKSDLATDTLNSSGIIQYYDSINKYSNEVIANKYNAKTIESCITCRSLLTAYNPFSMQKKGYLQLQNYGEMHSEKEDSLVSKLSQFYTFFDVMLTNSNEAIKEESLENLDYYKQQKWFIPWMQGSFTPEMATFFGESLDFKNRVAANNILATGNHQNFVKLYKQNATVLLEEIEKRIQEK